MDSTDAHRTVKQKLVPRGVLSALIALLFTACPTEPKLPTVTLSGLASVTTATTLVLTANATPALGSGFDNVGSPITKVELYDGAKKLAEKTAVPYAFEVNLTSNDNGKKQFKAKAYDQSGAIGESNVVTVAVNIAVQDTTPPTVVSIDPSNGSMGVTKDKTITVTFSEPMKQAETQAAYQSADLSSGAVTFAWSADGKVMTVKPNALLEYKVVANLNDPAKSYSFALTSTAADLAGNKLAVLNSSFSTLKQTTTVIPSNDALTGTVAGASTSFVCPDICVGDTVENVGLRGFITFDLTYLPANLSTQNILDASLNFVYKNTVGFLCAGIVVNNETSDTFDGFYVDDVSYDLLKQNTYDLQASSRVYIFRGKFIPGRIIDCQDGYPKSTTNNNVNTFNAVKNDWENRKTTNYLSQYRFELPQQTNTNGREDYMTYVKYGSDSPHLTITYLMP